MKDEWLDLFNPDRMTRTRAQVWAWWSVTGPLPGVLVGIGTLVERVLNRVGEPV